MINLALQAARDAAEAIAHSSDRLDRVKIINDDPDKFMTSMDQAADKTVLYHLQKAHPEHSYHSRVSGFSEGENKDVVWLIDPLIGNKNFAAGQTQFGVSVACQIEGVIKHGVIICPMTREEYVATRGTGARLNAHRLRVGNSTDFDNTLISLNSERLESEIFLSLQRKLLNNGVSPRITGCTAIDIIQTATDRLQGGWAANENRTSLAAASLILQEAGGLLASEAGNPDYSSATELVFANPKLFKNLLKLRHQAAM
jgi:myo-inositol-1(or 4)-monophosphatase